MSTGLILACSIIKRPTLRRLNHKQGTELEYYCIPRKFIPKSEIDSLYSPGGESEPLRVNINHWFHLRDSFRGTWHYSVLVTTLDTCFNPGSTDSNKQLGTSLSSPFTKQRYTVSGVKWPPEGNTPVQRNQIPPCFAASLNLLQWSTDDESSWASEQAEPNRRRRVEEGERRGCWHVSTGGLGVEGNWTVHRQAQGYHSR